MRVHSEKHGRHRTCRVSVYALFVMTSFFFLLRFSPHTLSMFFVPHGMRGVLFRCLCVADYRNMCY